MLNNRYHILKSPFRNGRAFCLSAFLITALTGYAQATLKFKHPKQGFGFVKKGEVVKVEYIFTNKGNEALKIQEAKAECSCTTVHFPDYEIKPGQTDTVKVYFDTKSVYDRQDRVVEIISNAKNSTQNIRFKGVVLQ